MRAKAIRRRLVLGRQADYRQVGRQAGRQAGSRLSRTRANGQNFEVCLKARGKALTQIRGVPNESAEYGLKARA